MTPSRSSRRRHTPAQTGEPLDGGEVRRLFHDIVDAFPEQIALVDGDWTVVTVNQAWRDLVLQHGYPELVEGADYLQFCRDKAADGHAGAGYALAAIERLDSTGESSARFVYSGIGPWEGRDFELCINRLQLAGRSYATVARYDITELTQLRRVREEYSQAVMQEQLAERRRIARDLHDSTSQLLAGIGLGLGQLRRALGEEVPLQLVSDIEGLLHETQREIRSMSYLAHPPELRKLGLVEAVRTFTSGFAARAGLDVSLTVDEGFTLPSKDAETAIYRIVQEALSNVHRHARADRAEVRLVKRKRAVHVVIADNGIGLGAMAAHGVGLSGMASRLGDLGGRLSIAHLDRGTAVIATLPTSPAKD